MKVGKCVEIGIPALLIILFISQVSHTVWFKSASDISFFMIFFYGLSFVSYRNWWLNAASSCSCVFLLFMVSNWWFYVVVFSAVFEAFQNSAPSYLWAFPNPIWSRNCLGLRYNIDSSWNVWSCKCTWTNSLPHWQEWACLDCSLVMTLNSLFRTFSKSHQCLLSLENKSAQGWACSVLVPQFSFVSKSCYLGSVLWI